MVVLFIVVEVYLLECTAEVFDLDGVVLLRGPKK
jgi:hypothetical protein